MLKFGGKTIYKDCQKTAYLNNSAIKPKAQRRTALLTNYLNRFSMSKTRCTRLATPTRREINCNTPLRYAFHFIVILFFFTV